MIGYRRGRLRCALVAIFDFAVDFRIKKVSLISPSPTPSTHNQVVLIAVAFVVAVLGRIRADFVGYVLIYSAQITKTNRLDATRRVGQ